MTVKNGSKPLAVVRDTEDLGAREDLIARVKARADTRRPRDVREPVELDMSKATASVINQALQQDVVRAVLGAYIEGKGLQGNWALEITGARLVPVEATS